NSPFQRLKYSLLLLIQLLLIALMAFAIARPYLAHASLDRSQTILMLDTSASMATRDAGAGNLHSRLEAAIEDATEKINSMRSQDEAMVMAFDQDLRQLTKFTSDRG